MTEHPTPRRSPRQHVDPARIIPVMVHASASAAPPAPRYIGGGSAAAVVCATTSGSEAGTPPATPQHRRKQHAVGELVDLRLHQQQPAAGQLHPPKKQAGRSIPAALGLAGIVVVIAIVGLATSDLRLRLMASGTGVPAHRLSAASFGQEHEGKHLQVHTDVAAAGDDSGGGGSGLAALLTSAAAVVAEQLAGTQPQRSGRMQQLRAADKEEEDEQGQQQVAQMPAGLPKWHLRCAVLNNLIFHIDVMAGWTYAFQTAGCDVTVYQNEHSLGIEDIMSGWLKGRFRKPEFFPGEAGDYHIVILPTFRDQHAEMVQYLLQLPRLSRQRYFLTQHNPDWLLNHPNVDILQQQLLMPLLNAEEAQEAAAQQQQDAAATVAEGEVAGNGAKQPLLRVQLATLAPCVSDYTLDFLRQMAFNLTEGYTYAERLGSFKVRGSVDAAVDADGSSSKDNSQQLRQWVSRAIDMEVPWMSPLVPWQPALALEGAETSATAEGQRRRSLRQGGKRVGKKDKGLGAGKKGGKKGAGAAENDAAELRPPPPHEEPPPPPPGAEAIALLTALNLGGDGPASPRHICIQGKLENSRRNYTAAFEAISHPAVLSQLRSTGERLLLLGHRSKWENVVVPAEVDDVVVVLESLPYQLYFDTLSRCRAILLAFATDEYYTKKSSSTIATAMNVGVPLVAERRTLQAYSFLDPKACFVYDDNTAAAGSSSGSFNDSGNAGGSGSFNDGGDVGGSGAGDETHRRRLSAGSSRHDVGGNKPGQQQRQQQQEAGEAVLAAAEQGGEEHGAPEPHGRLPAPGSYSAAILSALHMESSFAAHLAVRRLKADVMAHNVGVAAAFMHDTEQQYSREEQEEDAAQWRLRLEGQQEEEVAWTEQEEATTARR